VAGTRRIAEAGATPLQLMITTSDRQPLQSGNELVAISGRVINPTDREQNVPPIRAELRDKQTKQLVHSWTIEPPARVLAPRSSASFNSAEVDVPKGGDELTVSLASLAKLLKFKKFCCAWRAAGVGQQAASPVCPWRRHGLIRTKSNARYDPDRHGGLAEARPVARNAADCCAPAIGGADEGETEAANKIRGPEHREGHIAMRATWLAT
jgi:hypothetical protein